MADERYIPQHLTKELSEQEKVNLVKVVEECGEVAQAASKILLWGYDSYHPTSSEKGDNKSTFLHEWQDLLDAVQRLQLR